MIWRKKIPCNAMQLNMGNEQRCCKTASRSRLLQDPCHGLRDNMFRLKRMFSDCPLMWKVSQYLAGQKKINVESDHKPLQSIFEKSIFSDPCRLQRMMLRLQRFYVEVNYNSGTQMYVADLEPHLPIARRCQTTFKFSPWNLKYSPPLIPSK